MSIASEQVHELLGIIDAERERVTYLEVLVKQHEEQMRATLRGYGIVVDQREAALAENRRLRTKLTLVDLYDAGWEDGYDASLDAEGYPADSPMRSHPAPTEVHCPSCKKLVPKVLSHYVGAVGHDTLPGDEIEPYWTCQGERSCRER